LNTNTVTEVRETWAIVETIAPQAAALFYENLFEADPLLRPLFKGDMVAQGEKLTQMIGLAVGKLTDLDTLVPALQQLARRHVGYGAKEADYATVGGALLKTLEQGLGDRFTPHTLQSWSEVYGTMTSVMVSAAAAPPPA
jgi:hemoglobin-like flavoprotein